MRIPTLKKPRYPLVDRAAKFVLKELRYPEPPIPIEDFARKMKWEIVHRVLGGADGCMVKLNYRKETKFFLVLATDVDPDFTYAEETIRRRQLFTLAHEIGHILLHSSFIVDSRDMAFLSQETAKLMEQEANWFASRLLMPNYIFQKITDLLPDQIADKCKVNMTPANIRVKNLTNAIQKTLIDSVRLDKWPAYEDFVYDTPGYPKDRRFETWASYEEAAASSELLYICSKCSLLHNEKTICGRYCEECGAELIKIF